MAFPAKRFLVLIGFGILLLVLMSVDIRRTGAVLLSANPKWIALACLATLLSVVGRGIKWRAMMLEKSGSVPLTTATGVYLKAFLISLATPSRLGEFSRAIYLRRFMGISRGLATVIADRLIDILLLLGLAVVGAFYFSAVFSRATIPFETILLVALAVGAGLWFLVSRLGEAWVQRIAGFVTPPRYREQVTDGFGKVMEEFRRIFSDRKAVFVGFAIGLVNWALSALTAQFVGLSLGIVQPFGFFVSVVAITALLDLLPISVAGIGTRETAVILLFAPIGIPPETAVGFSLLYFAASYLVCAVAGGALFILDPLPAASGKDPDRPFSLPGSAL
ncbi:MAG: lysylphosphatidylglycerol synthase transmembrane domain-containing protein [Candidatus Diapherotrites archaeon]|nr:lysylphosphatidylglycerol synthase transmembrane domain-containing protein [Candidatus Diapherotrites archaeon]